MAYTPTFPGEGITAHWLYSELARIAAEIDKISPLKLDVTTVPLSKPRAVTLFYADGVNFDPGAGAGLYYFDGAYVKIATSAVILNTNMHQTITIEGVQATIG